MDALFVVVAELLMVPLVLWALIAVELTLGVTLSVVSYLRGRRSLEQALTHGLGTVRRRLVWSMAFVAGALLLADLVLFDTIVGVVLASVDDRDDLDIGYARAEGSFILGRIELDEVSLVGVRGGADPSARFEVMVDSLVIDIDTLALLGARFAVEDIAVDGVRGGFDRLRVAERTAREDGEGFELRRDFSVERVHFGDVSLALRDHTRAAFDGGEGPRELDLVLTELDLGPLRSDTAIFDLLYRVRGQGSLAGVAFGLSSTSSPTAAQTEVEVEALPLGLLADAIAEQTGLRVDGSADLDLTNVFHADAVDPRVEIAVALQLRELELGLADDAGLKARIMLEVAERGLARLGRDVPVKASVSVHRSELDGVRSLAESGLVEAVAGAMASSLRAQLRDDD